MKTKNIMEKSNDQVTFLAYLDNDFCVHFVTYIVIYFV